MNHLFRHKAPITNAGWEEIEKEARRTLRAMHRRGERFRRAGSPPRERR